MDYQNNNIMTISELESLGLNSSQVIEIFQAKANKPINLSDLVKVTQHEEASSIKVEFINHDSIIVHAYSSDGNWNKVE